MNNGLKKKYGLFTAIAMVMGIVIGSGVFFKAEKILVVTGGNLPIGILAWAIGGAIMMICAYTFATMSTRHEKVNGLVDYAEAAVGKKYSYYVGWFMATIYYPTLTSVLAWLTARYICVILGWDITGGSCMVIACFLLILSFVINTLSPIIAGKIQVSTLIIKLIPLLLMAVVGMIVGLTNGMIVENFTTIHDETIPTSTALLSAVVAAAFAYEGWIIATSINSEIKNSKKNLPIALVFGSMAVIAVYILYYIGLSGAVDNATMMQNGETGAKIAFQNVFGNFGGTAMFVFVVISCFGTLNGLMLGNCRGFYSIAVRNIGPKPQIFKQIDKETDMPLSSCVLGLLLSAFWLLFFYGAMLSQNKWFGFMNFDSSELPIITIYAFYIPIFFRMMVTEKGLHPFKRYVTPVFSILGSIFMIFAAVISHGSEIFAYLIVFAVFMILGLLFSKEKELE